MKKAVVFGGSGFLGSYVADELIRRGFKVIIADLSKPKRLQDKQKFKIVDILNIKDVSSILKDVSIVYNFSAIADLDEATKWKMGDGRPRGGAYIENERFWDLDIDALKYIMKDADTAMKAIPPAVKLENMQMK